MTDIKNSTFNHEKKKSSTEKNENWKYLNLEPRNENSPFKF